MSHRGTIFEAFKIIAAVISVSVINNVNAEEIALPITVTAKTIAAVVTPMQTDVSAMQRPAMQTLEPTLPGGKLPQYRLGHRQRDLLTQLQRQTGTLVFEVALPDRSLLVKATIRIDGQPFAAARLRRVEQLLATAQQSNESPSMGVPIPDDEPTVTDQQPAEGEASPVASGEGAPTIDRYTMTSEASELLKRYAVSVGEPVNVDEARWLIANWGDGPELLLLNEHFQSFRANERPVFHLLDRDRDGVVSSQELKMAVQSFQECDFNRDGVIDVLEIERAVKDPRRTTVNTDAPVKHLLTLLAEASVEPDVELMVEFDSSNLGGSKLSLVSIGQGLQDGVREVSQGAGTITLQIDQHPIAFSAVQRAASDQISVGAVVDGYPLLPLVDPNNDGRFTVRELRSLVARLQTFDTNGDGQLTLDEAAATTRVCIGLGPTVHTELANLREIPTTESPLSITPPDWFVRMDRNGDNDLTRDEFPGTDEQFNALDSDGDDLISAEEAFAFDQAAGAQADRPDE
jgi:hypothetical protein